MSSTPNLRPRTPAPPRARHPRVRRSSVAPVERSPAALVAAWFAARGDAPTAVQREVFAAFDGGRPLLVTAPTGSGKTAAVMLPLLAQMIAHPSDDAPGVRVLYLAPVRALSATQTDALTAMVAALGGSLRVAQRTGDTSAKHRAAQRERPPEVLLTTPESLAVLLAGPGREMLTGVRAVVLDELHLLAAGKRGALLSTTLSLLDTWLAHHAAPAPRRFALSATARPLGALAAWVHADTQVIAVANETPAELRITDPPMEQAFPDGAWAWRKVLPMIARQVAETEGTTLLFVGARTRAEQWSVALRDVLPARYGVACFHGSLSPEERARVADELRAGSLRVVVATSALEVGVDLPAVRRVLVLGAPNATSRLLQAAGRADHRPGVPARAELVPTSAIDVVRCAAAIRAAQGGEVEPLTLREGDLDVAVQAALGRLQLCPATASEVGDGLRASPALRGLSADDLDRVMGYLAHGGDALAAYPEMARAVTDGERWAISGRRSERRYRQGIGTIVGEVTVEVHHGRRVVGQLEGRFAVSLEVGDRFVLGGRKWHVIARTSDAVCVRVDHGPERALPAWFGQRAPQSAQVADAVEALWSELGALAHLEPDELAARVASLLGVHPVTARAVGSLVRAQGRVASIPGADRFVVELHRDGDRAHLVAFTFAGSMANELIARAVAARYRDETGEAASVCALDEAVCVTAGASLAKASEKTLRRWFAPGGLRADAMGALAEGVLSGAYFREVARVAQLWLPEVKAGAATPGLLHDVLRKHDPGHVLLRALDHTLWTTLEGDRAIEALTGRTGRRWHLHRLDGPSPLSIPARTWMDRDAVRGDDPERALLDAANRLFQATLAEP
jgi:ATP-dependent Lhr-like helicase